MHRCRWSRRCSLWIRERYGHIRLSASGQRIAGRLALVEADVGEAQICAERDVGAGQKDGSQIGVEAVRGPVHGENAIQEDARAGRLSDPDGIHDPATERSTVSVAPL